MTGMHSMNSVPCNRIFKQEPTKKDLSRFETFLSQRIIRFPRYETDSRNKIISDMYKLRKTIETANPKTERYFSMCAFTKQPIRNVFLRSLRYALKSRVLHASYTNQSCFEVFVLVDAPEYLCSDTLEEFLQSWNISCSCLQFDSFMEDGMITAIKRICAGKQKYGNWDCAKNQRIRQSYFIRHNMREQRYAQENVRVVTGLEYTTSNMLRVFFDLQNSESENTRMRARHEAVRRHLLGVMNELNTNLIPNAQLFHDLATQGSFTRMLSELMQMSFVLAANSTQERESNLNGTGQYVIDLT
jgi:hypothetical protein